VLAATAESSPSMRPLATITPGGTAAGASTIRQRAKPPTPSASATTSASRRRRALMPFDSRPAGGRPARAPRGPGWASRTGRRAGGVGEGLPPVEDPREGGADDGQVELPLAAEVVIDHGLVDGGLARDRRDRHAVVAALGEELGAGAQEGLARGGRVAAARP